MIRLITPAQTQELDRRTQESGTPAETLMENAGRISAETFATLYPAKPTSLGIICGPGNNAGDGLVMARHLVELGYLNLKVYLLFPSAKGSPLFRLQLERLKPEFVVDLSASPQVPDHDVYIDAVFGVGLSKPVQENLAVLFRALKNKDVISLDLPSGLDGETGEIKGAAVRARWTLTYGPPKAGCFIRSGPLYSGKIISLDVGFSKKLRDEIARTHYLATARDVAQKLPRRHALGNKTNYGRVNVWAGHEGMWGAAVLCARAATRVGAGYLVVPPSLELTSLIPEALTEKNTEPTPAEVYAVGPGWGVTESNRDRLVKLYESGANRVVIDADGLSILARHSLPVHPSWILTPHTGELSRLMNNVESAKIESDRFHWVLEAAERWGCTVLLKGFRSLVARAGQVVVVPTGNAALSKAGSGDVLTGMIAGLRAQNLSSVSAVIVAAYLHGMIADQWVRTHHPAGLSPTDLLLEIPKLMKDVQEIKA